jgi:hypothetical protein
MKTFKVLEFSTILVMLDKDDTYNKEQAISAYIAASALEYDGFDDHIMELTDNTDAAEKSISMFSQMVSDAMDKTNAWSKLFSGEDIQIFSGKYDYSLSYYKSDGKEMIFFQAK